MSGPLQAFLIQATQKAADDVQAALLNLPEDKRDWQPAETSRTALDQLAEIAILTGHTADLIATGKWTLGADFGGFVQAKAELSKDWPGIQELLKANLAKLNAALEAVPDSELDTLIDMPWGPMKMSQIIAYPYWNMTYHEGQINYIASLLGKL